MVASNPKLELFGNKVVKKNQWSKKELATKGVANFTQEEFDTFENYFNEDNWLSFKQSLMR
jgi:hypothetical protein